MSYVKCVFDLNTSISGYNSSDAFGIVGGSSSTQNEKNSRRATIHPWLTNLARQQFVALDRDGDGFIRLEDIQALFDQRSFIYESLVLKTESEFEEEEEEEQQPTTASN